MLSLFSRFDSYYRALPKILELIVITSLLVYTYKFNIFFRCLSLITYEIQQFFRTLRPRGINKSVAFLLTTVMFMLIAINISSIFPFNFCYSTQVCLLLSIGGGLWFCFNLFSFLQNFKGSISHFIPEGTPIFLVSLLFMIELIRSLIRPITLTVRLLANILAGHLILILLSNLVLSFSRAYIFYFFLNLVEIFVALIQSYIFVTLLVLYYSEI